MEKAGVCQVDMDGKHLWLMAGAETPTAQGPEKIWGMPWPFLRREKVGAP